MSPAAVTIGAATLSRSQSRRTDSDRNRDGDRHHHDRRQEPTDHRDHDEVGDRDRVLEAEPHRDHLGEDREHERDRERQRDRRREVLADDGVGSTRQLEGPGVDRGAEPAAHRAEHVAAHADRGGNEHEQAGQRFEGSGDRPERQPGEEVTARADQERDEARSDTGGVRAQQRAKRAMTARHERSMGTRGFVHFLAPGDGQG